LENVASNENVNKEAAESGKLGFVTKFSYGMGNLGSNLLLATANAFISFFYTESVGIAVGTVGVILLIGRIMDGVADILMGIIIDRTKSRYGKARPWLFRLAIPYALAMVLLFFTPDFGEQGNVIFALVSYLFAMFIYTGINVPYNTLMAMQTQSQKERTSLSAYRSAIGFVGAISVNMCTIPLVNFFGGGSTGWLAMGAIYGVIGCVLYLNVFKQCKEMNTKKMQADAAINKSNEPTLAQSFKSLFTNKYWLMLIALGIIGNLNAGLGGVNVYYAQYILGDPSLVGMLGLAIFLPMVIGVMVSGPLVIKYGKRNTSIIGALLQLVGCLPMAFNSSQMEFLLAGLFIRGLGAAPLFIASMAMLCDTVEYGEWKDGIRIEGLNFSAQSFSEKIGSGLGGVALGGIMSLGGYVGGQAEQSAEALFSMKFAFIYGPAILAGIMLIILFFYKLDKLYPQIVEELIERRGEFSVDADK